MTNTHYPTLSENLSYDEMDAEVQARCRSRIKAGVDAMANKTLLAILNGDQREADRLLTLKERCNEIGLRVIKS